MPASRAWAWAGDRTDRNAFPPPASRDRCAARPRTGGGRDRVRPAHRTARLQAGRQVRRGARNYDASGGFMHRMKISVLFLAAGVAATLASASAAQSGRTLEELKAE